MDRMRNSEGYSLHNVLACCGTCNGMKSAQDFSSFLAHVMRITENLSATGR
jgi:hypothetical protein